MLAHNQHTSIRDSPQCPLQIGVIRRMSLINANQ
jgi:hypothetical protein